MALIPITLDPGHAANYNRGINRSYYESNRMYDLSLYLTDSLNKYGIFQVYNTKSKLDMNPTLYDRATVAINNGSRCILSLHSNACGTPSVAGVEAMVSSFRHNDSFNRAMIQAVVDVFKKNGSSSTKNRGMVKKLNSSGTDYYGLIRHAVSRKGIQFPILMEHGFHTNSTECNLLAKTDFLRELADAEAKTLYGLLKDYYVDSSIPIYRFKAKASLNIRTHPSTNSISLIVGTYTAGESVNVISIDDGWARVLYHGSMYYAKASYLQEVEKPIIAVPKYDEVINPKPVDTAVKDPMAVAMANSVESECFTFFTGTMGLNTAAACGILANIAAESEFKETALGDSGTSYGLVQWHNERFTSLKEFAKTNGLNYATAGCQLLYLRRELEIKYPKVLAALKSVTNDSKGAYNAAYIWCTQFEIPANKEMVGDVRGTAASTTYWTKYGIADIPTEVNKTEEYQNQIPSLIGDGYTTDALNLRTTIPKGSPVTVMIDDKCMSTNWRFVQYKDQIGYCSLDYLRIPAINFKRAVVAAALNLRTAPSTKTGKVVKVLPKGTVLWASKCAEDPSWSMVVFSESDVELIRKGLHSSEHQYVSNQYLTMSADETLQGNLEEALYSGKLPFGASQVNCSVLNVRCGPGTNHPKVASIKNGTTVAVTGHSKDWTEIMYNGVLEYASSQYLTEVVKIGTKLEGEISQDMLPLVKALGEITPVEFFKKSLNGSLSSDYGQRIHPITKVMSFHYGIDIAANGGTPIYSPIDGVCLTSAYDSSGFGNYLRILAVDGTYHYFAHMKSMGIPKPGKAVYAGQKIGYVGTTGSSTGNHLHYEIRKTDGTRINPNGYQYTNSFLVEPTQA